MRRDYLSSRNQRVAVKIDDWPPKRRIYAVVGRDAMFLAMAILFGGVGIWAFSGRPILDKPVPMIALGICIATFGIVALKLRSEFSAEFAQRWRQYLGRMPDWCRELMKNQASVDFQQQMMLITGMFMILCGVLLWLGALSRIG